MNIILARHGQSTADVEDRYGGEYDDHLTDLGRQQVAQMGDKLAKLKVDRFYSSPRFRALETASIVGAKIGIIPKIKKEFRERNAYGVLSGLTKLEAASKYPDEVAKTQHYIDTPEGGEEYKLFGRRLIGGLHGLLKDGSGTTLVLTHGGPLRFLFRELLQMGEIEVTDCAYVILEAENGNLKLLDMSGVTLK